MNVNEIILKNFRSYVKNKFEFDNRNIVVGINGSGKSNLLEALYLVATGKSFRAEKDIEMIRWKNEFSTINYQFLSDDQITNIQITLTDGTMSSTKKKFEVNGVPRRMMDAVGQFKAVLFGPADMELLTGSPSSRRRYLDMVLVQTDREYRRCLLAYEKGLRQRNKLLDLIRDGKAFRNQLFFWDKLLIKNGNYLTLKREEYLESLNTQTESVKNLTTYQANSYRVIYDKSVISETRLKHYETEELAAGNTLVGPHRDDFVIEQKGGKPEEFRDVSKFGSRGEQRMAVMWLKTGELNYLTVGKNIPVLLLDDIFSELDHRHRQDIETEIEKLIDLGGQVIMTTADEHTVPIHKDWHIIKL